MKKNLKKSKKGFTLIELVVVIAILGILAAILVPVISGFISSANVAKDQANARNLFNSVSMALATTTAGTVASDSGTGDTMDATVGDLFGTAGGTDTWAWVVTDGACASATYNGQTYNAGGTFSAAT